MRDQTLELLALAAGGGGVSAAALETGLAAKQDKLTEITVPADGAVSLALQSGKYYHFTGTLTALTLTMGLAVTRQPADTSAPLDDTVVFHVEAVGDGLTYRWQSNMSGAWADTSFAASTTDTVSIKVTEARNGKQYRCRITDAGGNVVYSDPAILRVGESSGGAAASRPVSSRYRFDFVSGDAAPTVTMPASVTMPDGWSVEANRRYEVDILGGWGLAVSWEVSA